MIRTIILIYKGVCPFKWGDKIPSPVSDDTGTTYHFPGPAHINQLKEERSSAGSWTFTIIASYTVPNL